MKVHIYVLFLSIWTISSLDINKTNESSTTTTRVAQTTDSTRPKLDDFRKCLLGFIVGIMIITFTFTCFCLLHYNCMIDEVQPTNRLNKENMEAISSWVSKVSAYQPDIITEDILETQPLLLNSDHGSSFQEKLSRPNNTMKPDEPSSLEKPCIPSKPKNSMRYTNTDKSSRPHSVKKPSRELNPKRSTKSSCPQRLHKSSHLSKSYKKYSHNNSHKLAHTCKLASQINSSCSEKQFIPPWLTILQTSAALVTQLCPSVSNNHLVSDKPSRRRPNQASGCHDRKKSVSTGKAVSVKKYPSFKCGQCYKKKCLICNSEFFLNDLGVPKKEYAGNPYVSKTMNQFSKSPYEANYKYTETGYKSYQNNKSNESLKTDDSEDSEADIIIICNRICEDNNKAKSPSTS